jgi:hypothetical protein
VKELPDKCGESVRLRNGTWGFLVLDAESIDNRAQNPTFRVEDVSLHGIEGFDAM